MNIGLRSSSPVITANLSALLVQAGWQLDAQAPWQLVHEYNALTLRSDEQQITLPTPIAPQQLIDAITTHTMATRASLLALNHQWMFDPIRRCLQRDTAIIPLTEKEAMLLKCLADAAPHHCTRESLLKQVWSYEADIETHTLETHIYRLRQKLEALTPRPCAIETEGGSYCLVLSA